MIFLTKHSKTGRLLKREGTFNNYPNLIIRWGYVGLPHIQGNALNSSRAISNASNKPLARQMLKDAGIPVPQETEWNFPVVGRTKKHHGGQGFFYCTTATDVRNAKKRGAVYFSRFYPKTQEYRVHVGSGKTLFVSVKVGNKNKHIWNHRKSKFTFRHMHRSEWLENMTLHRLVKTAKKAVKALGLDFGAVDVLAFAGEGYPEFVVSEVNTSPALSPLARQKYLAYFAKQYAYYG